MNPFNPRTNTRPEDKIRQAVMDILRLKEWFVKSTHGNKHQSGFPDLFAAHHCYGTRWIEVKNALAYSFTDAQRLDFPRFQAAGVGIWILTAGTEEEYAKLFKAPNWWQFLKAWKH